MTVTELIDRLFVLPADADVELEIFNENTGVRFFGMLTAADEETEGLVNLFAKSAE